MRFHFLMPLGVGGEMFHGETKQNVRLQGSAFRAPAHPKNLFSKNRSAQKKTAIKGGGKYNKMEATPLAGIACLSIF
jgi:hypothetical protein